MASEPGNDSPKEDAETRTVRIFTNREAANIAAANLRAHDIHCWIAADDGGGMLPNLAAPEGVRLLVRASDAAEAAALIGSEISATEMPAQNEIEADNRSLEVAAPRKPWAPGQIFAGIVAGVLLCLFYQWASELGTHTHYSYAEDGRAEKAWVYKNGHLVQFLKDRNLDGAWDEWTYYKHAQIARAELDNNFDGKPDETWLYSNGALVRMEKDTDFNGTPDEFCTYKFGVCQQAEMRPNGAKFPTQRWLYQNGVLTEVLREPDGAGNFKESVRYDPFNNPVSTNKLQ